MSDAEKPAGDDPPRQPTRRSARLANKTNPAKVPDDITRAKERVLAYKLSPERRDKTLRRCLNSFLVYLPREGAARVAADILECGDDDDKLFAVFHRLRAGVLVPSKWRGIVMGSISI